MRPLWSVYLSSRLTRASSKFLLRENFAPAYCIRVANFSSFSGLRPPKAAAIREHD
jgi:hypothetical protein